MASSHFPRLWKFEIQLSDVIFFLTRWSWKYIISFSYLLPRIYFLLARKCIRIPFYIFAYLRDKIFRVFCKHRYRCNSILCKRSRWKKSTYFLNIWKFFCPTEANYFYRICLRISIRSNLFPTGLSNRKLSRIILTLWLSSVNTFISIKNTMKNTRYGKYDR